MVAVAVAVVGVAQVLVEVVYDEVFVVAVAVAVVGVAQGLVDVVYAEVLVVVWCAKGGKVNQVPHELLAARCQF